MLGYLNLLGKGVNTKTTPASPSKILKRHTDSEDFDVIKNLITSKERGSQSDISYIVHQCARFSTYPKKEHGVAIKWLGRYLLHTRYKGPILIPSLRKDMKFYLNADFASNYDS